MISMARVAAAARLVRIGSATFAVSIFVAYVALQAFAGHYSALPSTQPVVAEPPTNSELAAAITEQVERGLTCRAEPALTDTILVQAHGESAVQVLTFDQALAASSARTSWVRRYCF